VKTTIPRNSVPGLLLIPIALACFALGPLAQAQISPAPDGGGQNANTAEGDFALAILTTGANNTALGFAALNSNTTGSNNTAVGFGALFLNNSGTFNTAIGFSALLNNDSNRSGFGVLNTAVGSHALEANIEGADNTAVGAVALQRNTGDFNTAVGTDALGANTAGFDNTAIGDFALESITIGHANIAIGVDAGEALTGTESFNIDIAHPGVTGDAGTIRIGDAGLQTSTFIAGIRNQMTGNNDAIPVVIDSAGQLGTMSSSRRFKKEIKPMDQSSEAILALKPVTFHYKNDTKGIPQFGLIAEEVEKVNPDLVVRDKNGEIYTVRYDAVNAMLLNEFLKEHRKVQELKSTVAKQEAIIAQQQKGMEAVTARLDQQAAQIQKVSAQLEASKPAPQVVADNY
jgi:hypothetical protein